MKKKVQAVYKKNKVLVCRKVKRSICLINLIYLTAISSSSKSKFKPVNQLSKSSNQKSDYFDSLYDINTDKNVTDSEESGVMRKKNATSESILI